MSSLSAVTFMPTGVGERWETSRWVPTVSMPGSR